MPVRKAARRKKPQMESEAEASLVEAPVQYGKRRLARRSTFASASSEHTAQLPSRCEYSLDNDFTLEFGELALSAFASNTNPVPLSLVPSAPSVFMTVDDLRRLVDTS